LIGDVTREFLVAAAKVLTTLQDGLAADLALQ
jgi:hypothetical protein